MITVDRLVESGKFVIDREHSYGYHIDLVNTDKYCSKLLVFENSEYSSVHGHIEKDETFICIDGKLEIFVGKPGFMNKYILNPGDKVNIPPNTEHWYYAPEGWAVILETSTHDDDDDIYVLSTRY